MLSQQEFGQSIPQAKRTEKRTKRPEQQPSQAKMFYAQSSTSNDNCNEEEELFTEDEINLLLGTSEDEEEEGETEPGSEQIVVTEGLHKKEDNISSSTGNCYDHYENYENCHRLCI